MERLVQPPKELFLPGHLRLRFNWELDNFPGVLFYSLRAQLGVYPFSEFSGLLALQSFRPPLLHIPTRA